MKHHQPKRTYAETFRANALGVHENAIRKRRCTITYDTGFQRHSIVREFISQLNDKLIILERNEYPR